MSSHNFSDHIALSTNCDYLKSMLEIKCRRTNIHVSVSATCTQTGKKATDFDSRVKYSSTGIFA